MTTREEELSAQVAMLRGALTLFTLKPGWASNLSRGQQAMVESALVGAHEADAWSELSAEVARLRELVAAWQSAMPLLSLDASKCLAEHDAKVRAEARKAALEEAAMIAQRHVVKWLDIANDDALPGDRHQHRAMAATAQDVASELLRALPLPKRGRR